MKIYLCYDGEGDASTEIVSERLQREAYKTKITLPQSWIDGPCDRVLTFYCDTYNKKYPEKALKASEMFLKVGGITLPLGDPVNRHIREYNDVMVMHQPVPKNAVKKPPPGSLLCGNHGCGKHFLPEENSEAACRCHAKGPVFHDTAKYWACCPERKAYDFDDFERIPTCLVTSHQVREHHHTFKAESTIDNVALTPAQANSMAAAASAPAQDVAGPRRTGPREFEGATVGSDVPGQVVDGWATCRNFGCQQKFRVDDNHDAACTHHTGGPVFWDTYKYWACCPAKKASDFDDFVKIVGCSTGRHKV